MNLDACAREPIHIPGAIQPHGLLLAFDEAGGVVRQSSENAAEHLGRTIGDVLAPADAAALVRVLKLPDLRAANPLRVHAGGKAWDGIVHRSGDRVILELEPAPDDAGVSFLSFYHAVRQSVFSLQDARTVGELGRLVAEHVRALTGFDRVMLYKFDEAWNGTVIAEAAAAHMERYLDLRFPASDIPAQARRLYTINWLRLIAAVDYEPAKLVATPEDAARGPLDLSGSVLRSVSPVHLQYLRNMGVGASMSISVVREGRLWGLIACHHGEPRFVSYQTRTACEFLGQMLSYQLTVLEDRDDFARRSALKVIEDELTDTITAHGLGSLDGARLLALTGSTGAALVLDHETTTYGKVPPAEALARVVSWLGERTRDASIVAEEELGKRLPELAPHAQVASGVLGVPLAGGSWLLWFRPEVVETVTWAGDPHKPAQDALNPRRSFAAWQETVRGRAAPYLPAEVDAARDFRQAVLACELKRLNGDLTASNQQLDSYAAIIAHDLKEPVRGIGIFADFIREDDGAALSEESRKRLAMIHQLAGSAAGLLDALFHYSKVGQVRFAVQDTDLDQVARDAIGRLAVLLEERGVAVAINGRLPTLRCDGVRVGEVLYNLVANAAKYNDKADKRVEIGVDGGELYVKDNGVGIPEAQQARLFRMFRRLPGAERFGTGTGAGLTIARRIIERHGGTMRLESEPGVGSTFYFSLPEGGVG